MEKTVRIPNINCHHCEETIEGEIGELDGVEFVKASSDSKTAVFRWSPPTDWEIIRQALEELNYSPEE